VIPLTFTATDAQVVVLHVPTARTKYVVLDEGDTTMDDPLPIGGLPQLPAYHSQFAPTPNDPPFTVNVVGVDGQIGLGDADTLAGAVEAVEIPTAKQLDVLAPHKLLATTHILPAVPGVAVTEVVPCPELIVHPGGKLHV
jgi:hypothetical protein